MDEELRERRFPAGYALLGGRIVKVLRRATGHTWPAVQTSEGLAFDCTVVPCDEHGASPPRERWYVSIVPAK